MRQDATVINPFKQLAALFHNGQVGGKVGVENFIETEFPDRGNHLSGRHAAGLHTEHFTDSHTHRRGGLDHDMLLGIGQGGPDFFSLIPFVYSAGRANQHALAAVYAIGFG
ncbi:MAG: hypothetical protein A4E54_01890 [Pelotomaculum sp. PtaB.Bin117]|nr:MAG: hypothetical protein A4E54_01890 [Pelotomaculum sp. PtaB.Bin117]